MRPALSSVDPADALALSEQVTRALDRLPAGDRELLLLRVWDDLSFAETGQVLGCSTGAARVRWMRARRRFARRTGAEPKNKFGESLFATSAGAAAKWTRACPDADLLAVLPRYHPWWAAWVARVPGLREFASWNFVVVLRKRT